MMRLFLWMIAALMLALPGAAQADCQLGKIVELPITMRGRDPQTTAKINGREVRFTVDSGAFYSLISPGTAAENNLRQQAAPGLVTTAVGGSVEMGITTVKTFTIAGTDLHNIAFIVGGSEVGGAGLIGQNVLHIGDVEYDLPHGKVNLFKVNGCSNKVLAYWIGQDAYSELPLIDSSERLAHTIATIRINGQPVRATFDTGAGATTLSLGTAKRLGIKIDGPGVISGGYGRGVGSRMVPSWIVPIDTIQIGGETAHRSHLYVQDLGPDTDMLIGMDFFLAHRVFVANSQHRMWFTYTGGSFFDVVREKTRIVDATGKAIDLKDDALPTDAEGLSRHGMALLSKGDQAGALADLDKAVGLAPNEPRYLVQHAMVQARGGHPALAEADLNKALAIRPDDPDALIGRASMRLSAHEPAKAMEDMDRVSATVDKAADVRFTLAEMYVGLDRPMKAIAELDRWIAAHPEDSRRPIALNSRCWSRALLGQELPAALSDCNAAIRTMPHKETGLDSRGLVELRMGNLAAAVKDYDASLAISPKIAWSLYGRGLAELKLGKTEEAEKDIAAAKAIAPKIAERAEHWGVTR